EAFDPVDRSVNRFATTTPVTVAVTTATAASTINVRRMSPPQTNADGRGGGGPIIAAGEANVCQTRCRAGIGCTDTLAGWIGHAPFPAGRTPPPAPPSSGRSCGVSWTVTRAGSCAWWTGGGARAGA